MKTINQNILDIEKGVIVQSCNCLGIWGGGLARQLAEEFPEAYRAHLSFIKKKKTAFKTVNIPFQNEFLLGDVQLDTTTHQDIWFANIFGQVNIGSGRQTSYKGLLDGFKSLKNILEDSQYENTIPVYFPYGIGCGLGGGDWSVVEPMISAIFPSATICKL